MAREPGGRQVSVDGHCDLMPDLGEQAIFVLLGPVAPLGEVATEAANWLRLPTRAHLRVVAIACRIIHRGMVAQAVGERLYQGGAVPRAGPLKRLVHDVINSDHIVADDLMAREPGGEWFLCQGFAGRLACPRHRDRPFIIGDDKNHG